MDINKQLQPIVSGLLGNLNESIEQELKKRIAELDLKSLVNDIVKRNLAQLISLHDFPERSISHTSIVFDNFVLTGDQVKGGIIENFGSTGIEDRSTHVQMTLMDHATAFEGPLWAPSAVIKGSLTVDGDLVVKGEVPTDCNFFTKLVDHSTAKVRSLLNDELFESFSTLVHSQLATNGIELNRITQDGKAVITGNQLGYHIVDSNLQRVGVLNDLQTTGENLLSDTLYVTSRRVGVNTIDPSATFVVWDEECEMIVAKRKQDVGYIGMPRRQQLILGSNGKENIALNPDGTAQIENLIVGRTPMTSVANIPTTEGTVGLIAWNESPSPGSPIGWVCLGGTRWAKFGMIE